MPIITLAEAKAHLRLEPDYPDDQVQPKLDAAVQRAAQFLNRALFDSEAARAAAVAEVPAKLTAAAAEHANAHAAAADVDDADARALLIEAADRIYAEARADARETLSGIVATGPIKAGILLMLSHLFANRSDVEEGAKQALPYGSQYQLMPYRIGWGG